MSEAVWLSVALDPSQKLPLYLQLYAEMRRLIEAGRLRAGEPLPPSRSFAAELGVSRSTVVMAVEQLAAEGYLVGIRGSAVRVSDGIEELLRKPLQRALLPPLPARERKPPTPGLADPRLFPSRAWSRAVVQVARAPGSDWMQEDDLMGSPRLRRAIAAYLGERRELHVHPRDVMVTNGAAGAIELVLAALTEPGDSVAVEDPGARGIHAVVANYSRRRVMLPVDEEGARVRLLAGMRPSPKVVILTPSNQYPLGPALSVCRRHFLLRWAAETGAMVVEDDYDSEFRFVGKPLPALAAISGGANVLNVGSFSKMLSSAISLGYLVIPPALRERFRIARNSFTGRPSIVPQAPLALFMEAGELGRHLRRMRKAYGERRLALLSALRAVGSDLIVPVDRPAGMHLIATLGPDLIDIGDEAVAAAAREAGIHAKPLSEHYLEVPAQEGLVIGFSGSTPDEIAAFADRFPRLLARLVSRPEDQVGSDILSNSSSSKAA